MFNPCTEVNPVQIKYLGDIFQFERCIFVHINKDFVLTKNNPLIWVKRSFQTNRHFLCSTQRTVQLSRKLYESSLIKWNVSGGLKCFHITKSVLFTQQKEGLLTSRVQGLCTRDRVQSPWIPASEQGLLGVRCVGLCETLRVNLSPTDAPWHHFPPSLQTTWLHSWAMYQ